MLSRGFLLSDIRYPRYPNRHCVCYLEWHRSLSDCCIQCVRPQADARVAGDCGARINYFGCCLGEFVQRIAFWLNKLFERIVEKRDGAINMHQLINTKKPNSKRLEFGGFTTFEWNPRGDLQAN